MIDPRVNARAIAAAAEIQRMALPGVRDVVSTYRSVAIFFDPLKAQTDALRDALARVSDAPLEVVKGKTVDVPVVYGGEAGPDVIGGCRLGRAEHQRGRRAPRQR